MRKTASWLLKVILTASLILGLTGFLPGCGNDDSNGGASSGAYKVEVKLDAEIKTISGYVMGYPYYAWSDITKTYPVHIFNTDGSVTVKSPFDAVMSGDLTIELVGTDELKLSFDDRNWGTQPTVTVKAGSAMTWGSYSVGSSYSDGRSRIGAFVTRN